MKSKKKRVLGILLSFALMLTMMPLLSQTSYAAVTTYHIVLTGGNNSDCSGSTDQSVTSPNSMETVTYTPKSGYHFETYEHYYNNNSISVKTTDAGTIEVKGQPKGNPQNIQITVPDAVADTYPLWVGGTQVTGANMDDVLDDGTVSFTPAFNDGSGTIWAKLTLKGANITKGKDEKDGEVGIFCGDLGELVIELADGTDNKIGVNGDLNYGILHSYPYAVHLKGNGKLTTKVPDTGGAGIDAYAITFDGSDVTATGGSAAIHASNEISIVNRAAVNASGSKGGIEAQNIQIADSKVTASGSEKAIFGKVKNEITGTGWTDAEGKTGKAKIEISSISSEGQDLPNYKKVQFPEVKDPAKVTTKPAARTLTANGKAQQLVTAGKAEGGTMQYAIGKDSSTEPTSGWSAAIPAGTKAGTYYVWYKATGDASHGDSAAGCVKSTIKEKPAPKPTPKPAQVSGPVVAKAIAKGSKTLKFSWNKVNGAATYEVYLSKCGAKYKKVRALDASKVKWTKKGLKKKTAYKFYVEAKDAKGKTIGKSLAGHVLTSNVKGKYTNAKSLKLKKSSVNLKKGGTFKIKATQKKARKGKKLCNHTKLLRYTSSNPSVATVSKSGVIKGVKAGKCTVYVQTVNGIWKTVSVSVK